MRNEKDSRNEKNRGKSLAKNKFIFFCLLKTKTRNEKDSRNEKSSGTGKGCALAPCQGQYSDARDRYTEGCQMGGVISWGSVFLEFFFRADSQYLAAWGSCDL